MKKKLLFGAIFASFVLGPVHAQPVKSHSSHLHKKGLHKSMGQSGPSLDELLRRIEALEAELRMREADSQRLAELEEELARLQNELVEARQIEVEDVRQLWATPDALTELQPQEEGFYIGASVWDGNVSGGEQPLFQTEFNNSVGNGDTGGAGTTLLSPVITSALDDDSIWELRAGWNTEDEGRWAATFFNFDDTSTYNASADAEDDVFIPLLDEAAAAAAIGGGEFDGDDAFVVGTASRNLDINDFRFEKEQRVVARRKFALNFAAGIRGAEVDDNMNIVAFDGDGGAGGTALGSGFLSQARTSDFTGIGPSAGMTGRYALGSSLEIQGSMRGALLLGDRDVTVTEVASTSAGTAVGGTGAGTFVTRQTTQSADATVPVMDAELKLVWHAGDSFDLSAGYQANHYFNAVGAVSQSPFGTDPVAQQSDINLDGLKFGLDWTF